MSCLFVLLGGQCFTFVLHFVRDDRDRKDSGGFLRGEFEILRRGNFDGFLGDFCRKERYGKCVGYMLIWVVWMNFGFFYIIYEDFTQASFLIAS